MINFQRHIDNWYHWDIEIECLNKDFFMNCYYLHDLLKLKVVACVVAYVGILGISYI